MLIHFKQVHDFSTFFTQANLSEKTDSLFWTEKYMKAIQEGSVNEIEHILIAGYNENQRLIGVFAYQFARFRTMQLVDFLPPAMTNTWGKRVLRKLLSFINPPVILLGNLLQTSQNGLILFPEFLAHQKAEIIHLAFEFVHSIKKVNLQLIINTYEKEADWKDQMLAHGFIGFYSDPDLHMQIPESMQSEADYLSALHSKYRVRAKKVLKDSSFIEKRELNVEEVQKYEGELFSLNREVMVHVKFSIGDIDKNYFSIMKSRLPDAFLCFGYFDNEKLIGFSTAFVGDGAYRAHFIGMDYSYVHQNKLYNRMLYDHLFTAISMKCSFVEFGRTATEIKTTIGAEPMPMWVFLKHRWKWLNLLIHYFARRLKPSEFTIRHPFRDQADGSS